MKEIVKLPHPKNDGLISHINGKLRDLERDAGIKKYDIKTKPNKNEVHIVGKTEQIDKAKELLNQLINKFLNTIIIKLPYNDGRKNKSLCRLITGKQGENVKKIQKITKADINVTPKGVHVFSEIVEHRKHAETEIRKFINQIKLKKVTIPPKVKGKVIGHQHSNIKDIEKNSKVAIEVIDRDIYVLGEEKNCKMAILQLKKTAAEILNGIIRKQFSCKSFDYISTKSDAAESHSFTLSVVDQCPNPHWVNKEYFKITVEDEEKTSNDSYGEIDLEQLKKFINDVLKDIQKDEGNTPKADLWCHFGHIYIKNVDEDDQNKHFSLQELQKEFNREKDGSKMLFDPAVKDMEINHLEEVLEDYSVPPHIRYDFQFITPSCSKIRVKIFLNEQDGQPNAEFSKEDIDIRESTSASSPLYFLCDNFYHRAKISIAIPFCKMDIRMTIRTVSEIQSHDQKERDYEKTLRQYLDKIEIKEGKIVWPDDKEIQDDFCLSYLRRCKRRSYTYISEGKSYSLTLSEEEEIDVLSKEVLKNKTDIHIHSDEWDQLLCEGEWEPESIVSSLPQFLEVLSDIQKNISVPCEE